MKVCEECLNYKKVEKKEHESCYRNRCDGCKCKNCNDFAECDSADKKCSYCKFHNTNIWSGGTAQTATWTPNGRYNVL